MTSRQSDKVNLEALREASKWITPVLIHSQNVTAEMLGGHTSSSSEIFLSCKCDECKQLVDGITTLDDFYEHATRKRLPEDSGEQDRIIRKAVRVIGDKIHEMAFGDYMRREAKRRGGETLVNQNVCIYWWDTPLQRNGKTYGTWYPAVIKQYYADTGEYLVKYKDGSQAKVFLPSTFVHWAGIPPAPGQAPRAQPGAPPGKCLSGAPLTTDLQEKGNKNSKGEKGNTSKVSSPTLPSTQRPADVAGPSSSHPLKRLRSSDTDRTDKPDKAAAPVRSSDVTSRIKPATATAAVITAAARGHSAPVSTKAIRLQRRNHVRANGVKGSTRTAPAATKDASAPGTSTPAVTPAAPCERDDVGPRVCDQAGEVGTEATSSAKGQGGSEPAAAVQEAERVPSTSPQRPGVEQQASAPASAIVQAVEPAPRGELDAKRSSMSITLPLPRLPDAPNMAVMCRLMLEVLDSLHAPASAREALFRTLLAMEPHRVQLHYARLQFSCAHGYVTELQQQLSNLTMGIVFPEHRIGTYPP